MDKDKFLRDLERISEEKSGALNGQEKLESIGLDSFGIVELMSMIHENYGVNLSPDDIFLDRTIQDLIKLIEKKTSEKKGS